MIVSYLFASAFLIVLGLYSFFVHSHFIKKIMAINIIGHGGFLFFISISSLAPGESDPVPHAMVLTGIVVAFCATAFSLFLARRIFDLSSQVALPEDEENRDD